MKRLTLLFISTLLFLIPGCKEKNKEQTDTESLSSLLSFDYDDVKDFEIQWENILLNEGDYYAYIYSKTCMHCIEIKEEVLEARLLHNINIYYILYNKDIDIVEDRALLIGIDDVKQLGILGTPSLFEINEHQTLNYFAGKNEILHTLTNLYEV